MTYSYLSTFGCKKQNTPSGLISNNASIFDITETKQKILSEIRDKSLRLNSIEIRINTNKLDWLLPMLMNGQATISD